MTLPLPKLIVFYNGKDDKSDRVLRLSDSFLEECDINESDVEVTVHMVNIRPQYKSHYLEECKPLAEYSWFIEEIRKNSESMEPDKAVDKAIEDMPNNYEIKGFLTGHRAEVVDMCLTEYNEAETMQMFKEEGREEGIKEGRKEGKIEGKIITRYEDGMAVEDIAVKTQQTVDFVNGTLKANGLL